MRKTGRGEIVKIGALFETYKKRFKAPQGSVIAAFHEVVDDVLHIPMRTSWSTYTPTTRTLTLSAPGPIKTEILLRKQDILLHLKGRLGERSTPLHII
jgi:hypothetical protein